MTGTGVRMDFSSARFNLMDVSYFRNLGSVLEKFSMEDISKKTLLNVYCNTALWLVLGC